MKQTIDIGTLLRWNDDDSGDDDLGIVLSVPLPTCTDCPHTHRADCHDLVDCGREHPMDFADEYFAVDWIGEPEICKHTPQTFDDALQDGRMEIVR